MKTIGRTGCKAVGCLFWGSLLLVGCSEDVGCPEDVEEVSCLTSLSSEGKTLEFSFSNGVTMNLFRIEPGKFMMGSPPEADRVEHEKPQHEVTLTEPFYMGVTEVTQAQWKAVMATEPWEGKEFTKSGGDHAANWISWDDATAFCRMLSKKTGRTVRLPTEAEWEYACRAGTTTMYSFGDDPSGLGNYAWYFGNIVTEDEKWVHPVGLKQPNPWGLYDMHGNVWEWCADWYAGPYANADAHDPKGPAGGIGIRRVTRGGSCSNRAGGCTATMRAWEKPDKGGNFEFATFNAWQGFRVVVSDVGAD